jgi:very-short-patch-repair endonuclease
MCKCEFCTKEFSGSSYSKNRSLRRHLVHCRYNPNRLEYTCKYCGKIEETSSKIASHTSNCKSNPNYESIRLSKVKSGKTPRKHSEETKKKISEIRKKYLQENPDKVPYKLNHSSKESYPEKYFTEVFKNEGIEVVKSFYIGLYELDFCIPNKKIDIEIDGNQHYYDEKIVESDKRRNKFLEDEGWDIIRVNWSEYQKLSFEEKREYILNLKNYINNLDIKPFFETVKKEKKERKKRIEKKKKEISKKEYICKYCSNICTWKKDRCEPCYRLQSRKIDRPSIDQLKEDVEKLGYTGTGRKYGVSDNSIRKWIKLGM